MQPNQNIGVTEKDTTTDCYWLIDSSLLQEDHLSQDEEMERYILVYNYHGMHIRKSIVQHSVTLKFREPLQSLKVITAAHCLLPTGGNFLWMEVS
jgi:hypothetical protein